MDIDSQLRDEICLRFHEKPTRHCCRPAEVSVRPYRSRKNILLLSNDKQLTLFFNGLALVLLLNIMGYDISWASSDIPGKSSSAPQETEQQVSKSWHLHIDDHWGGYLRLRGSASWPSSNSPLGSVDTERLYDGQAEFRVKNRLFFGDWGDLETHYEVILSGGDTRRTVNSLNQMHPDLFADGLVPGGTLEDDRRVMDLTGTIDEDEGYVLYHRFDRLALSLLPKWGTVRVGRQAVTWGNGLLFNPMDLFNPFSPADIERDYKVGDDMVSAQFPTARGGELQFLYVPRRSPTSGEVEWGQSSLAGKLHLFLDTTEFDIMAAEHYEDAVFGLGSTGYLGDAAWRLDGTWISLNADDGYLSVVANMDYSWIWGENNWYGFLEFYLNGLSHNRYSETYGDSELAGRIERGDLYTLGRTYVSGHVRVELHPLFNVYVTVIENLADPSGVIQPRAVWDIAKDVQITFGGALYHGQRGTEYGGVAIPGTSLVDKPPGTIFIWVGYFF
jgi:hypothetical protein